MKELKKLRKAVQTIRLSEQEKRDGRNEFLEFMEKNPVHRQISESSFSQLLKRFYAMTRRPLAATATLMGVFVVTASGISYAAESSLPGDLLYPVKVQVNEQVQGFFNFDAKSQAQWEIDRMNRRLEEVQTLKDKGKLDIKIKSEFKQELNINNQAVEQYIQSLRAQGDEAAAKELEASFEEVITIHEEAAQDIEFNIAEIERLPEVEDTTEVEDTPVEEEDEEGETTTTDVTEIETSVKMDTDITLP